MDKCNKELAIEKLHDLDIQAHNLKKNAKKSGIDLDECVDTIQAILHKGFNMKFTEKDKQ